jgi:hypothetical protein
VKNVLEGAKRKLATPTVKKEPITPELLSLMYNSNYKENDLFSQRTICACLLAYAGFLRVSVLYKSEDVTLLSKPRIFAYLYRIIKQIYTEMVIL